MIILRPGDFRIGRPDGDRLRDAAQPDRLYVRAFARTGIAKEAQIVETCDVPPECNKPGHLNDPACDAEPTNCTTTTVMACARLFGCSPRLAFANPVWAYARRPAADLPGKDDLEVTR
jgi:hypothetical protein